MCPPLADKFYLLDCFVTLAMTGVLASVPHADWRPCRNLRVPLGFVSQTPCHCEPRMWRGNPVSKSCASAHHIYQNCARWGAVLFLASYGFCFIGYRRGTRHPSRQPIGHQLCTVCHQILCLLDSFLQRDWLPNHPLSPVQPPQ